MASQSTLDSLRYMVNLRDLIAESVELKSAGHRWQGKCPFHDDSAPSLSVNLDKGLWYCHGAGCNKGGDAFHWVMETERCSFRDAVEYLCRRYGINIPEWTPEQQQQHDLEQQVQSLLAEIIAVAQTQLEGSEGEHYLLSRGISLRIARQWGVGYVEKPWDIAAVARPYPKAVRDAAGVTLNASSPMWSRRVLVPMVLRGRTLNIYGRSVRPEDEYDTDEMYVSNKHRYLKDRPRVPVGLDHAGKDAVLVEGVLDALAVAEAGRSAVAVGGMPSTEHADLLARWLDGRVYVGMDADEDDAKGLAGALRLAAMLCHRGRRCSIITWPRKDPNEVLQSEGKAAIRAAIEAAAPPLTYRTHPAAEGLDASLLVVDGASLEADFGDGRRYLLEDLDNSSDAKGVRANVRCFRGDRMMNLDNIGLYSSIQRKRFANAVIEAERAANLLEADERSSEQTSLIANTLLALEAELQRYLVQRAAEAADAEEPPGEAMPAADREAALKLLKDPYLVERIVSDVHALGVVGEDVPALVTYLTMTSRKMAEPLYLIFKAESSAGKSYLLSAVAELCPPEDLRNFTRITPTALFWCADPDNFLHHKFLIVSERPGAEAADYSIRTMLSERGLTMLATEKQGDKMVAEPRTIRGPLAYAETTTALEIHAENETRLLEIYLDESEEHTRDIHERQRWEFTLEGMVHGTDRADIKRRHRNAQRLLRQMQVIIPYARHLTFPSAKPRTRRDQRKFLNLVSSIAFLHQYRKDIRTVQRGDEAVEYIEADIEDYTIAYELARGLFSTTLDELDRRSRDVLRITQEIIIEKWRGNRMALAEVAPTVQDLAEYSVTRREVAARCEMSQHMVNQCMNALNQAEFLRTPGGKQGQVYHYYLEIAPGEDATRMIELSLLSPEDLAARLETNEEVDTDG